jgi:protein gp37
MSDKTEIEWAMASWNPLRGQNARHTCARISPGCDNCYAATMTRRGLGGTAAIDYGRGETPNDPSRLDEVALLQPLRWKKPRTIFVCSMTDLFGAWVPDEWICKILNVMLQAPQHTYQILTKRPKRMQEALSCLAENCRLLMLPKFWPLPNVWVGVSIESDTYVWRANYLRETPAAVRWISAEPLLSGLPSLNLAGIDWLVAGGESGPDARPMHPDWARDLRDRCQTNGTAYFFKQHGEWLGSDQQAADGTEAVLLKGRSYRWPTTKLPGPPHFGMNCSIRVGKKAAGRLLDGVEHSAFPEVRSAVAP